MPTRADFYIGDGAEAEWLGSVPWDGYPEGIDPTILTASTEHEYRNAVSLFLTGDDGCTLPSEGWPWAWNDSRTTDYAYTWMDGRVWGSNFGDPWFLVQPELESYGEPGGDDPDKDRHVVLSNPDFPDMKSRKNTRFNRGSGFIHLIAAPINPKG